MTIREILLTMLRLISMLSCVVAIVATYMLLVRIAAYLDGAKPDDVAHLFGLIVTGWVLGRLADRLDRALWK